MNRLFSTLKSSVIGTRVARRQQRRTFCGVRRDRARVEALESRALLSANVVFGNGGIVETTLAANPATHGYFASGGDSIAVQADGKIVVGNTLEKLTSDGSHGDHIWLISRYNPDGSLDGSFGQNGDVIINFGTAGEVPGAQGEYELTDLNKILIAPDGKIVAAGHYENWGNSNSSAANQPRLFAAARLNADGGLDTTFGAAGELLQQPQSLPGLPNDYFSVSEESTVLAAMDSTGGLIVGGSDEIIDNGSA
ncbi:MAG TPA: delta-60 repeat domain-containing protein [Pirellulales bacterium]|nr:delta-60 repeat domain-containing protein [Pirellulales bacterium]